MKKILTLGTLIMIVISAMSSVLTTVEASEISNPVIDDIGLPRDTMALMENPEQLSDFVEITMIDQNGEEHDYNPYVRFSSSVIYIGIKMKYTSKADANKLLAVLNKTYGMGTIGNAIGIFSSALGGIPGSIVGSFIALGFNGFRNRCKESISVVKSHPSKGTVYMYLDHVTWKAS
jgi:hypothetical protein